MKSKFQNFLRKHVARMLAIVMAFSTFASSGLAFNSVKAEPTIVYGDTFVDQLVAIAASGTPYVWGGQSRNGVDCSNYVVLGLKELFGNATIHYQDGSTSHFSWTGSYPSNFASHVGEKIYVEGNGKRMYFTVALHGTQGSLKNQGYGIADMKIGDYAFSSTLSKYAKTPGTIICYNGHCVVGIGVFNSAQEVLNKYPSLNRTAAGTNGGPIVRFYDSYYNKGNTYSQNSDKYWFGKTCYIAAASTANGLRTSNASATGKVPTADNSAYCTVLVPDSKPLTSQITIKKVDAATGKAVPGARYMIYKDAACTQPALDQEITTSTEAVVVTIERGTYYIKETYAPNGWELSTQVHKIDATGESVEIKLKDDATEAELLVRKVDVHDPSNLLSGTVIKLYEYNKNNGTYNYELTTLQWSETKQGFVISGPYTDADGTRYTDNALHATATNQGRFYVMEVSPQAGYAFTGVAGKAFNILTDSTIFTGDKSFTNVAKLALKVKKTDTTGTALTGAKFSFAYNGETFEGTTDASGYVWWNLIDPTTGADVSGNVLVMAEGDSLIGTLTEKEAPSGYVADPQYASGKQVVLQKNKVTVAEDAFVTEVVVSNETTPPPPPTVYDGKIRIQKANGTAFGAPGVEGAHYGVFTDSACTVAAVDKDGVNLGDIVTDATGSYTTGLLEAGIYYVKETKAPQSFGIQLKTFMVHITGESEATYVLNYNRTGVNDKRQIVDLTFVKTDVYGDPLEGAVFALYLDQPAVSPVTNKNVSSQLIGYYVSDEKGVVYADRFGSNAFTANGQNYDEVIPLADDNSSVKGQALVNGVYHFEEVGAPAGYKLNSNQIKMAAIWRPNNTPDDVVTYDNGNQTKITIGPAGNSLNLEYTASFTNKLQSVIINLSKEDDSNGKNVNQWYNLSNYAAQAGTQVAELPNAEYALVTTESIRIGDIVIPANTIVATEKTDADGNLSFYRYNASDFTGNIQNGQYKIVELSPSFGYSLNNNPIIVDARAVDNQNSLVLNYTATESILKQALEIEKVDGDTMAPIEGVTFEMYAVSKILDNGGSVDNLTRESFQQMIDNGIAIKTADLNGATSWTTDANGKVTTGLFVFDSYVLWEKEVDGYAPADPKIVELPSVETTEGDTDNGNTNAVITSNYAHIVQEQPTVPFGVQMINFSNKVYIQIIKIDSVTGETITGAEFKLYDDGMNQIIQNGHGNPWTMADGTFTTDEQLDFGTYHIWEETIPAGYLVADRETILTISNNVATAIRDGEALEVTRGFNAQNKVVITVKIPNDPNVTYFAKYETVDGNQVHVDNVELAIQKLDGTTVESWNTSTDTDVAGFNLPVHTVNKLPLGEYKLVETSVPAGYIPADPISFTVDASGLFFSMENQPKTLTIDKQDMNIRASLPGATLQLLDSNGRVATDAKGNALEWVSDGQPKTFKYVKNGTYTLHEVDAPVGYQLASDKTFVVSDDASTTTNMVMDDPRTEGKLIIHKYDAQTGAPLAGVKFEIRSKNEVREPITNTLVYAKDQIIETVTTNVDGVAEMTEIIPIATYDANGLKDYIELYIVETQAAPGQYAIKAISDTIKFAYVDGNTPLIVKTLNLTNEKPVISVTKTGTPETFVGNYADKHDITVLQKDDIITYTIAVTNSGMASAYDVTIKDALPANTEFVSAKNLADNTEYVLSNNVLYATLDEVQAGETINIEMKVKVAVDTAAEIVNIAYWTMPNTIDDNYTFDENGDYDWTPTDSVVHQVVEFHKTSEVLGGDTVENAIPVSYGDTITYRMTFKNVNDVKNVVVTDVVPLGLKYVSGSAVIDGTNNTETTYNPGNRMVTFEKVDLTEGTHTFEFKVTVEYVEANQHKDFDNVANVEYTDSTYEDTTDTIESEHVTHYAEAKFTVVKHGTPATYEGLKETANNLTVLKKDAEITYIITVTNTGNSSLKNIVVSDAVPAGTTYVNGSITASDGVVVAEQTDIEVWKIAALAVGESVDLTFKVTVDKQEAAIIDNVAKYAIVPEFGDELPDDMAETNHVIHQVVDFHKASEIPGGNPDNPAVVATDDTIVYTLSYISKAKTTGVIVGDKVPTGLTLTPGTIQYKLPGTEEWVNVTDDDAVVIQDGNTWVIFPALTLDAGTTYFRFSTTVDRISVEQAIAKYVNRAAVSYDKEPENPDSEKDVLESEEIAHMTEVSIVGEKNSNIATFKGEYEERNDVTVVSVNDEIVYTISVKNTGVSDLHNVVIKDVVPENTELVADENPAYTYDEETKTLFWMIDELPSGETVDVQFTVKVTAEENTAKEIVNIAEYAVPIDPDDIDEDEWIETDAIVYQLVEFHKGCSIDHGTTQSDALFVEIGTKFSYILTFTCVDDVYNLVITDAVPVGLKYIVDSANIKIGDETNAIGATLDAETNTLTFDAIEEVKAGTITITFDVEVLDVEEYDTDYFFVNQAKANVQTSKDSDETVELISETISHKTNKTNKTPTPVLGFDGMNASTAWSVIALLSFISMLIFGYIGFVDRRKRTF